MYLFEVFGLELDFQPLIDELQTWWASLLKHLPNILLAIIVIFIGFIVTKVAKRYIDRVSRRLVHDSTVAGLLASILTALLVLAFLFLTLSVLQLTGVVASLLGAAGVIGLALGLAFQDPILNLFSGIMLSIRNLFREGDLIEVGGFFGKVQKVNLRNTILMTLQGQEVLIPNKTVAQEPIKNYNKYGMRRVDLSCGVSYGDDLAKVKELTIQAIKDSVPYDTSKEVQLFFNEFGNSSINYTLRFWIADRKTGQADYLSAQSEAIMAIKRVYDSNDIMIPFPIRTLDFGIKGGEKLSEMLSRENNVKAETENGESEHHSE
ncbi:small conductance mechanosensitive channel [Neolewinella xylanilytica]|uniref:Small conductance mechanosensitive channel n=1 Tax=Neolewinella xylanilytica TaxID=1514080 RepID=A0A2S6I5B9_9BACT|nr:mechanosensitive ion channel family protein [Neolewinella xylanilytica]PPK86342.1 small conductance mechanosensitive channel [Neolewinella xylanilytica]